MKRFGIYLAGPLVALGLGTAGLAGPAGDKVFAIGVLETIETNSVIEYTHTRTGPDSVEFLPIKEGGVTLKMASRDQDMRVVELTMNADGRTRQLDALPASAGNPILMAFMESSLRSMAKITGGSPFYIRNRMRSALRDAGEVKDVTVNFAGQEVAGSEVTFKPFTGDPNAQQMGVFSDLEIKFVVSEDVPGYFLEFSAKTPDGVLAYSEEILLISQDDNG